MLEWTGYVYRNRCFADNFRKGHLFLLTTVMMPPMLTLYTTVKGFRLRQTLTL